MSQKRHQMICCPFGCCWNGGYVNAQCFWQQNKDLGFFGWWWWWGSSVFLLIQYICVLIVLLQLLYIFSVGFDNGDRFYLASFFLIIIEQIGLVLFVTFEIKYDCMMHCTQHKYWNRIWDHICTQSVDKWNTNDWIGPTANYCYRSGHNLWSSD